MFVVSLTQILILAVACFVIGKACSFCCLASLDKSKRFYIEPSIGLAVLILLSTIFGWHFAFKTLFFQLSFGAVFLASLIYLFSKKNALNELLSFLIFCTLSSLVILLPLLRYNSYNPFTDIFTYLAQAQWLQDKPFSEQVIPSVFKPAETQILLYQAEGSRMGASFFLAGIQAIFRNEWSYQTFPACVSIAFSTGCYAASGIISQISDLGKKQNLLLALLIPALPNGFIYGAQWGFYPQTFGLSMMCAILYLIAINITSFANKAQEKKSQNLFGCVPLILLSAALFYTYNELVPILAAGIFLYLFLSLVKAKNKKLFITHFSLAIAGLCILIAPELKRFLISFINGALQASKGALEIGWPVRWTVPEFYAYSFGLKWGVFPFKLNANDPNFYLFPNIVAPAALLLLFVYWTKKNQKAVPESVLIICCINLLFFFAFLKLRYFINSVYLDGATFAQFKLMKWLSPINIALMAGIAGSLIKKNKELITTISLTTIVAIGMLYNYFVTSRNLTGDFLKQLNCKKNAFEQLVNLRCAVKEIAKNKLIFLNIPDQNHKLTQMICYILHDEKVLGDFRCDGYIRGRLPQKDYNNIINNLDRFFKKNTNFVTLTYDPLGKLSQNSVQRAGPFVFQNNLFSRLTIYNSEYPTENNGIDHWNWVNEKIVYKAEIFGKKPSVKIQAEIIPTIGHNKSMRNLTIDICDNNFQLLERRNIKNVSCSQAIDFSMKNNLSSFLICISSDGNASILNPNDNRLAKFQIKNMKLDAQ